MTFPGFVIAHSFAGWTDVTDYTKMYEEDGSLKTDLSSFTYAFESYCTICGEKFTVDVSYTIFSALEATYDSADEMKKAIEECYTLYVNGYEYVEETGYTDENGYVPADDWFTPDFVYESFVWSYSDSYIGTCVSGSRMRTWTLSIETSSSASVFTFVIESLSSNGDHSIDGLEMTSDGREWDSAITTECDCDHTNGASDGTCDKGCCTYNGSTWDCGYDKDSVACTCDGSDLDLLIGGYVYDESAPEGERLYYYEIMDEDAAYKYKDKDGNDIDWDADPLVQGPAHERHCER